MGCIKIEAEVILSNPVDIIASHTGNAYIGPPGKGVPVGGTARQALIKKTDADYDVEWADVGGAGTANHAALVNLDFENSGHTGFQPLGDYALKSELPDVSNFITRLVDDLANYYLSTETYTQEEVRQLIGQIQKLTYEIVEQLPTDNISTTTIYLLPKSGSQSDVYNEYLYINSSWELIGNTDVDLSNYPTKQEIYSALALKQDKLTAGSNINITDNVISAQMDIPSTGVTAALFMTAPTTLSPNKPAATQTLTYNLVGVMPLTKTLTYTAISEIIISPTALYSMELFYSNSQTSRTYTLGIIYRVGSVKISEGTLSFQPARGSGFIEIEMNVNLINQSIVVPIGGIVSLDVTIAKNNGGNEIIDIVSSNTNATSIIRNGGTVSTDNVYELDQNTGRLVSQHIINVGIQNQIGNISNVLATIVNV